MEFQLMTFPGLLTAFFLFLLSIFTIQKIRSKSNQQYLTISNLPPGPWKLPLIGNIHSMVGSLPHHSLRDLANKYGPLMHLRLGEVSMVVVSSAEVALAVMKTHDITFSSRPRVLAGEILFYGSTDILFSPYGKYWRQLRKICTLELLSAKRVQSFRWIREEEVSCLVERIASNSAGSPVNLTENLFSLSFSIIARTVFSNKCKSQERFLSLFTESLKLASGFDIADVFPTFMWIHVISGMKPKLEKMHREIDELLEIIIDEHRVVSPSKTEANMDLIDVLLNYEDRDDDGFSITTRNIKAVIFDMFVGGTETSAITIDWAMAEMLKRPEILERAQAEVRRVFDGRGGQVTEEDLPELKFLNSVIQETLRLHPPVPLIPRACRERCEIEGFEIPAKTKVIVNVWAIGRDPRYWREPETFNPERFLESHLDHKGNDFQYIPFGAGRRICPGMTFAIASMEFQLAMLLYHFDWKLPPGMKNEDLDMTECFGLSVKRKDDMFLIPTRYHPYKNCS